MLLLIILSVCYGLPVFDNNSTYLNKVYTEGYPNLPLSYKDDITRYSEYAALAYCSRNGAGLITGTLEDACGCQLCHGDTIFVEAVYKGTVSAAIFRDEDLHEIILSLKGTTNKREWMIDGKAFKRKYKWFRTGDVVCNGCTVHSGFYDAAKAAWDEIVVPLMLPLLHNEFNGYSITITGHSLGGSLAIFIGNELKSTEIDCRVETFGSPKIAGSKAAQWMDNEWKVDDVSQKLSQEEMNRIPINSFIRVTNAKDVVPYLPSVDMGYYHSGVELLFNTPQTPALFENVFIRGKFDSKKNKKEERKLPGLLWGSTDNKWLHNRYVTPMNKCVL